MQIGGKTLPRKTFSSLLAMSAVSPVHNKTIKELQNLPGMEEFALAGGTNLALRYNHRESVDIDLFCNEIIGFEGFKKIQEEVQAFYGNSARSFIDPMNLSDQFTFLRFFIHKKGTVIKVDIIQNMKTLDEFETLKGIRLYSLKDIGLFKLMSASSRPAKKDIYDLAYITNDIPLIELYEELQKKQKKFNKKKDRNIFDIDNEESVLDNPLLLLNFDSRYKTSKDKMMHSHDNIVTMKDAKSWREASSNWRIKLRGLFNHLNIPYPSPEVK
jgi:hypothetical protein